MLSTEPASGIGATSVPLTRLDFADGELLEELMGAVRGVAERGAFTLGEPVEGFEREFAAYCETDFAIGVSSGTEALALALRALEIGPGDEVIVPTNSFIATAEAVSAVGATPKLVDVDPDSHLITAEIVAENLGPKVRCVLPVHLFGATVDLDPILALTREAGIHVVEDACQAHGARYRGRRAGAIGILGCFSFYPTKNLGGWGDGGAVVTAVPELAERLQLLRSHGERPRYNHRVVGTTARLDALQAAVLRRKLIRLDAWNTRRRELGSALRTRLASALRAGIGRARDRAHEPSLRWSRPRVSPIRGAHRRARRTAGAPHTARDRLGHPLPHADTPHGRLRPPRNGTGEPACERAAVGQDLLAADLPEHDRCRDRPSRGRRSQLRASCMLRATLT